MLLHYFFGGHPVGRRSIVFFLVEGCGSVHLTGNLLNDGRDMLDMEDGDDNMEIMDEIEEENGITEEINGNSRTLITKMIYFSGH